MHVGTIEYVGTDGVIKIQMQTIVVFPLLIKLMLLFTTEMKL